MPDQTPRHDDRANGAPETIGAFTGRYDQFGRARYLILQSDMARAIARRLKDGQDLDETTRDRWQAELAELLDGLQVRPERLLEAPRRRRHRFRPTPHPHTWARARHDRRIRTESEGDA